MNDYQCNREYHDSCANSTVSQGSGAAADLFCREYINSVPTGRPEPKSQSGAAESESGNGRAAAFGADGNNQVDPVEQRKAEERQYFTQLYRQQNFELEPFQKGWGPFQVLSSMVKDQKIFLNEEQVLSESIRIRDRDFKNGLRNFYRLDDRTKRWSEAEIAQKVEQAVNRAKGIDVSAYQNNIDWSKVKGAGYQFAFLKASEGGDWVDPRFAEYREGALKAGLAVGYYHYFRPATPVSLQVKNFVKTVGKTDPGSLRLVVDLEEPSKWSPYTVQQRVKMIDDWCQGVKKELGVTPQICVYGSPSFFKGVLANAPELGKYSLWIAHYRAAEPDLPKPWSQWDFWQYTSSGKVPGINGNVDLDMYYENELEKLPADGMKD
jgi:lysozyme